MSAKSTTLEYAPAAVSTATRPLAGFGNIFQKELREWFKTRKFLATAILTTLMLAAVPAILFLHEGGLHDGRIDSGYRGLMEAWVALTLTLGSYLVVSLTMGVLIKEEDAGTAQWIFTKPVSRVGYVLAKYAANCLVVILAGVLIPGLFYFGFIQLTQVSGVQSWTAGFEVMGFASLHACVVIGLVMGLSAFFRGTAPVAGIAIGLGFIPLFFFRIVDGKITGFFPINIGAIASQAAHGNHLTPWQPVISGAAIAIVGAAFACARISRRQL